MKKVLVDFDNTLIDFNKLFYNKIKNKYGYNLDPYDCPKYDFSYVWDYLNVPKEDSQKFFNIWNEDDNFYDTVSFLSHVPDILKQISDLKKEGYTIVLDTKISEKSKDSKLAFVDDNLKGIFDEVCLSKDLKELKSFDYDVVFEDNPTYIKAYLEQKPNGLVVLARWKYNEKLLQEFPNNIITPEDNIIERIKK